MKISRTTKTAAFLYLLGGIFLLVGFFASKGEVMVLLRENRELSFFFWGMVILLLGSTLVFYRTGFQRGESKNRAEVNRLQALLAQREAELSEMNKELDEIEHLLERKTSQLMSVSGKLGDRERRLKRIKEILGVQD
jgi:cell shape-determining protein MreC